MDKFKLLNSMIYEEGQQTHLEVVKRVKFLILNFSFQDGRASWLDVTNHETNLGKSHEQEEV